MDKINEKVQIKLSDIDMTPILLAAIIGFVLIAIFIILRRRASGRRDLLLMGLSESGKSAIFMQLIYNKFPDTFTSIKENVGDYQAARACVQLVDIPGHYRVRDKCFETYKNKAKGIVFVVDSVTAQKEIRDVADALYAILADSATAPCSVSVLCNKQDQSTAKSAQVVKSLLEKELNIVRDTRSRKLQSVGEDDAQSKSVYLGRHGKDFEFAHITQNVQFFEGSAKNNELSTLTTWIERIL